MFSQTDSPPRLRGMTWSTVRLGLVGAAVLAGPAVAGEDRLAGDAPAVDVPGHPDEADQADDLGAVEAHRLGAQDAVAVLEHLGLLLEQEHQGPPHGADVERLVARVEDQDPPARQPPGGGYRYLGVDVRVVRCGLVAIRRPPAVHRHAHLVRGHPVAHVPRKDKAGAAPLTKALRARPAADRSGSCRGRAPTRPCSRSASIASATGWSFRRALEVDEEHVAAQPPPQRPRLDPGQVHLAVGEDLERLDQRPGVVLAELREDEGGPPRSIALGGSSPPARPRRSA